METPLHLLIHALKAVLRNEENDKSNLNKNISPYEDEDEGEDKAQEKDLKSNLIEIAKLLISAGADISLKDKYWRTPLFLARWYRIADLIKLLTEPKNEHGYIV